MEEDWIHLALTCYNLRKTSRGYASLARLTTRRRYPGTRERCDRRCLGDNHKQVCESSRFCTQQLDSLCARSDNW
eukprot:2346454-Rhodomonas_salina.1